MLFILEIYFGIWDNLVLFIVRDWNLLLKFDVNKLLFKDIIGLFKIVMLYSWLVFWKMFGSVVKLLFWKVICIRFGSLLGFVELFIVLVVRLVFLLSFSFWRW